MDIRDSVINRSDITVSREQYITHETDGIKYDGDAKRMEERLPSLPGCNRFHRGWLGVAKKEIVPFIEALNPEDAVFCLFNTKFFANFGNVNDDKKYKNVLLSNTLVGGLQDRILIVTQHGESIFQIPYADIDKVKQSNRISKDGEINIIEKNGTKANFFLDTMSTDTELLGSRFCSWVNKNIHNSEHGKGKSDKEITYDTGINYSNFTVKDLKEILRKRGLPVGGKSDKYEEYRLELIERLEKDNYKIDDKIDARDIKLTADILKKYKAPKYEDAHPPPQKEDKPYPFYLSFLTFILYCLGFLIILLYAYHSEDDGKWENHLIFSVNVITIGYVQLYLFSSVTALLLLIYIFIKNSELELEKIPLILNYGQGIFAGLVFTIPILILFFKHVSLTIPCCSTLFLIATVGPLEKALNLPEQMIAAKSKIKKRKWFDACKHEERHEFYAAKKIWLNLDEDKQALRLEKILLELGYVKIRRRILNMEEKGINCSELKEKLRIINTDAGEMGLDSINFSE
tara:strand:- start:1487 stop:3034 length:1548 start_codon:yes stop_codon:yes gene_type:complete